MKKVLILLIASFLKIGCTTHKQFVTQDNICYIDDIITDNEKNIDPTYYELLIDNIDSLNLLNDNSTNVEIWKLSNGDYTHKQTNKQTNIGRWIRYSTKGTIKNVKYHYENGLELIGKETHFDEDGDITKIIDHRQADKYPICYKEALLIVEDKIGKRDSITNIRRDEKIIKNDTLYYWSVYVKEPDPANGFSLGKSWAYQINAANGKLIKKLRVISNPG